MPNLPSLPSARGLAAGPQHVRQPYGAHCTTTVTEDGVTLSDDMQRVLVHVGSGDDTPSINLARVETANVPYVNVFLSEHGLKVERYWRTKQYRIVGSGGKVATTTHEDAVAFMAPAPAPEALIERSDVALAQPRPEIVRDDFDPSADIPGVERPAPIKPKSAGKGWTSLGGIVIPDIDYATLTDAWNLRQSGVPASVLITGPAGTAKTALVRAFAASLGVEFLKVDGGAIRTADDWAGAFRQDPNTKTWQHRWSPFARVLQRGTPMVVLVDEITRTETTQALNALLGLFDWTGTLLVPDANAVLRLPAGILVVATANMGPEFVGTLPLDGAVRQRFPFGVRLGYPEPKVETKIIVDMSGVDHEHAERLVTLAELQRANREDPQQYPSGAVISTRVILDIARRIQTCSTTPRDAVLSTLKAQFDPGDEAALSILVDSQYPVMVEMEDDSVTEISPEVLQQEADRLVIEAHERAQKAAAAGSIVDEADRITMNGQFVCTSCGRNVRVTLESCNWCGTPNPILVGLAAAASAAPKPLITVARHFFVARGLDGQLTTACQYRPDPSTPKVCGRERRHAIHHD